MALSRLLAPANKEIVKTWRTWSGITVGGQMATSVGTLVARAGEVLPAGVLHEQFLHMALAIAFVTALPLAVFPRVISVSLAQMGVATSLMYIGYAFTGAFPPGYELVITAILSLVAFVFLILFFSGSLYLYREKCWSDLFVGSLLLAVFVILWLRPTLDSWR